MANLSNALQQLREERRRAQLQVEKLQHAIAAVESLNGSVATRKTSAAVRTVSAVSRRRMARAQRARWAKLRKPMQSAATVNSSAGAPRRTLSQAARKKIAVAQRARWARVKALQKKAA